MKARFSPVKSRGGSVTEMKEATEVKKAKHREVIEKAVDRLLKDSQSKKAADLARRPPQRVAKPK